jgi:hypothetical protein
VWAFALRVWCVQLDPLLTFEAYAKHKVPNARQLHLPKGFMPEEKYGRVLQELQSKYSAVVKRVCATKTKALEEEQAAAFAALWQHAHYMQPINVKEFRATLGPLVAQEQELQCLVHVMRRDMNKGFCV